MTSFQLFAAILRTFTLPKVKEMVYEHHIPSGQTPEAYRRQMLRLYIQLRASWY